MCAYFLIEGNLDEGPVGWQATTRFIQVT